MRAVAFCFPDESLGRENSPGPDGTRLAPERNPWTWGESVSLPENRTSYDEVPYKSFPFPQSHPDRLATVATLFGMTPPPVEHCRVLELGCSSGGNLIPLAEQLPESRLVGIDASQRQIADGQETVRALGLTNIDLQQRDIASVRPEFGEFDYIIAHGVFSWVPNAVQDCILEICARNLAPQGIAYVSYNTYPGWHMDFVRNRMFRQTLRCHRGVALDRGLSPERVHKLHMSSPARPEAERVNLVSTEPLTFRGPNSVMTTTEPLVKAAMLQLVDAWPVAVPFNSLLATARSRTEPQAVVVDTGRLSRDARRLAEPLLRCYATTQVELSVRPSDFTIDPGERPTASRLARHQARASNTVTNLRHTSVQLSDLERHVLQQLDGQSGRAEILSRLLECVASGELAVQDQGQPVRDSAALAEILRKAIDQVLPQLGRQALILKQGTRS